MGCPSPYDSVSSESWGLKCFEKVASTSGYAGCAAACAAVGGTVAVCIGQQESWLYSNYRAGLNGNLYVGYTQAASQAQDHDGWSWTDGEDCVFPWKTDSTGVQLEPNDYDNANEDSSKPRAGYEDNNENCAGLRQLGSWNGWGDMPCTESSLHTDCVCETHWRLDQTNK